MAYDKYSRAQSLLFAASAIAFTIFSVSFGAFYFNKKRWWDRKPDGVNPDKSPQARQDNQSASPSSSLAVATELRHEYEVFLSFRGSDNRKGFTDCLYHALLDAGVRAFRDNEELRVGQEIGLELMRAIKQSKILMPIFSKDYASSKWCHREVAEMVKCIKETKQVIMPIFLDITPDDVQHQTGTYAKAFRKHEKYGHKMVPEWRNALEEVTKLKGLELEKEANGSQGEFIKLLVAKILRELKRACLDVGDILVGIDDQVEEVMNLLDINATDVRIVGIYGMGGIGKTTIAKVIYNQLVDFFGSWCFLDNIRETSRSPQGLQYLQKKLASDILRLEQEDFGSVDEGLYVLNRRLQNRKALILLDDVDHIDQLKSLIPNLDCFRMGSRIIITTREKEVLLQFQVQRTYEVTLLNEDQAFELFSSHAFRNDLRPTDFVDFSWDIVKMSGRLPLALEVIGSFLSVYRGRRDVWEGTIEQLRMEPNSKVQDKLRISYDALDYRQRQIFLDIACFFIGTDVRLVIPMWDDCKFFPTVGLEILLQKSLVKIVDDNKLWMHDQLRDMGRHVVEQENYREPGLRSRLWHNLEAINVLVGLQGTSKVEAISLNGYHEEITLNEEMLKTLPKLRIFQLACAKVVGDLWHLMVEMRLLSWEGSDLNSMPGNLPMTNLVVLDLSTSGVGKDWSGWGFIKIANKLKVLNLSSCQQLFRTPDFSSFPPLEVLILEYCKRLVFVDPSIGCLKTLRFLNLRRCSSLNELPGELGNLDSLTELLVDETAIEEIPISGHMKKLEIVSANRCERLRMIPRSVGCLMKLRRLSLEYCSSLKELPDSIGQLKSLTEMSLSCSGVCRLPDSVANLSKLELLNIDLTEIAELPRNLRNLKKLKVLDASKCYFEGELPSAVGMLSFLSVLRLDFTKISRIPASISSLSHLQALHLQGCWYLQALPKLPASLITLTIEVSSMSTLPNLTDLINLRELNMSGPFKLEEEFLPIDKCCKLEKLFLKSIDVCAIPQELSDFSRLKEIDISWCGFKKLPKLPSSLTSLKIAYCCSLENLPDLSNLKNLVVLQVYHCSLVTKLKGLGNLLLLKVLDTSYCPITMLEGLERLACLVSLSIKCCPMERLADLSHLTKLVQLDAFACTELLEIEGIDSLDCLQSINLIGLSAVKRVHCLSKLQLHGTRMGQRLQELVRPEGLELVEENRTYLRSDMRTKSEDDMPTESEDDGLSSNHYSQEGKTSLSSV